MATKKLSVMEESDRALFSNFFHKSVTITVCCNNSIIDGVQLSMYEIYSKVNFFGFNIIENNKFNDLSTSFYREIIKNDKDHFHLAEKYNNNALKDYVVKNYFKKDIAANYVAKNISSVPEIEEL